MDGTKTKAVLLCGGKGTRLYENTRVVNKHLCRVGTLPMVEYPLKTIKGTGITDVMIITGKEHCGTVLEYLGSGEQYGMNFTFRLQERAGGIAEALGLARGFIGDGNCLVVLGDNIITDSIKQDVISFTTGCKLFVKEVDDPERFGVLEEVDGKFRIREKPKDPLTKNAVIGFYLYDNTVFDKIDKCNYSARGEKEITDVNNLYIEEDTLDYSIINGFWSDAGTIESIQKCDEYLTTSRN